MNKDRVFEKKKKDEVKRFDALSPYFLQHKFKLVITIDEIHIIYILCHRLELISSFFFSQPKIR